jgi:hypothetical protein
MVGGVGAVSRESVPGVREVNSDSSGCGRLGRLGGRRVVAGPLGGAGLLAGALVEAAAGEAGTASGVVVRMGATAGAGSKGDGRTVAESTPLASVGPAVGAGLGTDGAAIGCAAGAAGGSGVCEVDALVAVGGVGTGRARRPAALSALTKLWAVR